MNPNSGNQRWSKWIFTIVPGPRHKVLARSFADVKANAARFAKRGFKSATSMRVTYQLRDFGVRKINVYVIEVLTEGHDVHDPAYVDYVKREWTVFAEKGFGPGTTLELEARLMAGSRQDGTPADQLIIAPSVALPTREDR
jgi:hypothetical protein